MSEQARLALEKMTALQAAPKREVKEYAPAATYICPKCDSKFNLSQVMLDERQDWFCVLCHKKLGLLDTFTKTVKAAGIVLVPEVSQAMVAAEKLAEKWVERIERLGR